MRMIWWYWRNCEEDIWTRPDVSKTTRKAQSPFRLNSHSGEKHCLHVLLLSWWSQQIIFCEVEILWKPSQQTCQRPGLHRAWVGTWCSGRAPMCPSRTWEYLSLFQATHISLSQVPAAVECHYEERPIFDLSIFCVWSSPLSASPQFSEIGEICSGQVVVVSACVPRSLTQLSPPQKLRIARQGPCCQCQADSMLPSAVKCCQS